jgi:hypothetical protein
LTLTGLFRILPDSLLSNLHIILEASFNDNDDDDDVDDVCDVTTPLCFVFSVLVALFLIGVTLLIALRAQNRLWALGNLKNPIVHFLLPNPLKSDVK